MHFIATVALVFAAATQVVAIAQPAPTAAFESQASQVSQPAMTSSPPSPSSPASFCETCTCQWYCTGSGANKCDTGSDAARRRLRRAGTPVDLANVPSTCYGLTKVCVHDCQSQQSQQSRASQTSRASQASRAASPSS